MPTITVSYKDLQDLIGKHIRVKELGNLLHNYCKIELDNYDEKSDELVLSAADTNMPFLWSVEGIARRLRGVLGIDNGREELVLAKEDNRVPAKSVKFEKYIVHVDSSVEKVRPFISCFVAKSPFAAQSPKGKLSGHLLKQLIQLQEKVCEGYGRKREKVSVGLYPCEKIEFPVYYRAVEPKSVSFIPLDFSQEMSLKDILETHPKGKEYAKILENAVKYPVLIDSEDNVLSFPPIINSERMGKVTEDDSALFFDATGVDEESLKLVTNIFALALHDRGFEIIPVTIHYPDAHFYPHKKLVAPDLRREIIKIKKEDIQSWLGIELYEHDAAALLKKAGYGFKSWNVKIPFYRGDIMHSVDVIEDIAMMYGYENVKQLPLMTLTRGKSLPIIALSNKFRELVVGLGYQELMSLMLTNKRILYEKMCIDEFGTIEISNPMSETHSVVRTWLIPLLLSVLEKNKHVSYPQKIFEQGIVTVRRRDGKEDIISDYERLAIVSCHKDADFTEIKQLIDYLFRSVGLEYSIEDAEHGSFIPGRVGRIVIKTGNNEARNNETENISAKNEDAKLGAAEYIVKDVVRVGFVGEIHPAVLQNFELDIPVVAAEINLTEIFNALIR